MKTLITAFALLLCCGSSFSQSEEEMKAWEASMTKGQQHLWLAKMDGVWSAKVKMWMDPTQPADESEAITKNEMIMNGLYQRSSHTGKMMGMPFHGEGIVGYDNVKKKFVAAWIDNMGSGIMVLEGDYDETANSLILTGSMIDPTNGNELKVKEVLTINSPDKHTFNMYMIQDGKETKTMEIVYTKAKS